MRSPFLEYRMSVALSGWQEYEGVREEQLVNLFWHIKIRGWYKV